MDPISTYAIACVDLAEAEAHAARYEGARIMEEHFGRQIWVVYPRLDDEPNPSEPF